MGSISRVPLLEKIGEGDDLVEKPMSPSVLIEVKVEDAQQRREHAGIFFKEYHGETSHEPNDPEIARHFGMSGKV